MSSEILHFIGVAIKQEFPEEVLESEFTGTIVEWKRYGGKWCIYYANRWNIGASADQAKISLTEHEMQHFIGVLKRVRNESLYQSYPDDLGLKHVETEALSTPTSDDPIQVRVKPSCRRKGASAPHGGAAYGKTQT